MAAEDQIAAAPESTDPIPAIRAILADALARLNTPGPWQLDAVRRLVQASIHRLEDASTAGSQPLTRTNARDALETLEQEQRRLARDIHDGPAQVLTNLAWRSDIIARLIGTDDERAAAELAQLRVEALGAAEEVRQIIYQLVPPALQHSDLATVLKEHVGRLRERYGLSVQVDAPDQIRYDTSTQVAVFRIIQEALQNVLRHAETMEAWVRITVSDEGLVAVIWDNGKGFDLHRAMGRDDRRLGLLGMRERAELAGGSLQVDSRPGQGTRVTLLLPPERSVELPR